MNEAFKFSGLNNKCSVSQIIAPTTADKSLTENMQRIKSLPSTLQEKPVLQNDMEDSMVGITSLCRKLILNDELIFVE